MGWLFGNKKKKSQASTFPKVSHEQSLTFNEDAMHDKVIHPDHIKAAAGVHDDPFKFDDHDFGAPQAPSSASAPRMPPPTANRQPSVDSSFPPLPSSDLAAPLPSNPMPSAREPMAPSVPNVKRQGDDLYIKVRDYKRILGELKDLSSELSHVTQLTKDLEHSEYNEEKNFLRMKDSIRKVHDKLLTADKVLFSHN